MIVRLQEFHYTYLNICDTQNTVGSSLMYHRRIAIPSTSENLFHSKLVKSYGLIDIISWSET